MNEDSATTAVAVIQKSMTRAAVMDTDTLVELVRNVVASELEIDVNSIANDKSLRLCYGLDSVAAVNIVFSLENQLDVTIDLKDIVAVDCIDDLRQLLTKHPSLLDQLTKRPR